MKFEIRGGWAAGLVATWSVVHVTIAPLAVIEAAVTAVIVGAGAAFDAVVKVRSPETVSVPLAFALCTR